MKGNKVSQAWKNAAAPLSEVVRSLPMTLRAKLLEEGYKFGVDLTHKNFDHKDGPRPSAVIEPPVSYAEKDGKRLEEGSPEDKALRKLIAKTAPGLKL